MKIVRYIVLEILLLVVMVLCGTAIMKLFDILLKLNYENIWLIGFKVGFITWLIASVIIIFVKVKKEKR